jgi:signal transduction histidine kinase/DNA-binding NarL/FixJ family response regulator
MIPFAQGDLQFANQFVSRVVYDFSALNRFGRNVLWATLASTALITLAVFTFASFRFNRVMLRRFETINRGLERIAGGDYEAPLDVPGADDLARVGANIDAMRERIQRREASLVESESSLRSVRDRLEETVRDRTAELIRANASLRRDREALTIQSRELEAARDEAERANRAKTAFLANVSHEVRTPMNAVLGFSEMLREKAGDDPDRHLLDAILSSARALLALIDDLLDLSKIEAGALAIRLEPMSVGTLLAELERMFRPRVAEKGVTLDVMTGPEVPAYLLLDPVRVRQILTNLLSNAIRFTDEGGITVWASGQPNGPDHFDLVLEVRDSGIGIPESERERVFEAFHQVNGGDRAGRGGSGLGLAIVRRLVERMGGTTTVESAGSGGTRFRMRFPGREIANPVLRASPAEAEFTRRFLPANVLIADDMNTNRLLLAKYLESCDQLSLRFAGNGETALAMTRELQPDLVLMDLQMPGMGGLEAARRIKEYPALSSIPVLAVTAHTAPEILEAAGRVCDALLIKPIRKSTLFSAMANFLAAAPGPDLPPEAPTAAETRLADDEQRYAVPPPGRLPPDPWLPKWNHVRDRMVVDEIQRFGEEIRNLGTGRELPGMARWGADLAENAETLEIDRMYRTLDRFPELVAEKNPETVSPAAPSSSE